MHQSLPATTASVAAARRAIRGFIANLEVDVDGITLAVSEAVANVVTHAYPDGDDGVVELTGRANPFDVVVEVRDHGCGLAEGDGSPGAGFGLPIIHRLAHQVDLRDTDDGVALTMAFRRGGAWAASP
jgi:anti-sigma regulatory factor (Ser/Thr protein kinase)